MNHKFPSKASLLARGLPILLAVIGCGVPVRGQVIYVVDQFDPSGTGGNSYTGGRIGVVWTNWFGGAFSNLVWDSASDANGNPASGSVKITANFNGGNNQFEVYDVNNFFPTLNGLQYTNFQCDVRFAQGSAATTNGGVAIFGHLQFGIAVGNGQDYFGAVDVPASNTNWVHVSLLLNAAADPNLQNFNDVLIHIYGPQYSPALSGVSTLWVDNIQFTGATPVPTNCVVNWNDVHQRIDGFGASSAWRSSWTTNLADLLFSTNNGIVYTDNLGGKSTNNGIGLSLLRTRIAPASTALATATPTSVETNIMLLAQARGARVWSTPWTPASGFKNNNNPNGGSYLGNGANPTNLAYARQLANYVASMKSTWGITLYAVSIQNEPDAKVTTYEACSWTAQQIHDFTTNLYNALLAQNLTSTLITLPESQNWQDYSNLTVTAMNDSSVAADAGIIADHNYDGVNGPSPLTKNSYGKALWETEVSLLNGSDSSINNGVYYAQRIHQFMAVAQANAWHYWWLISGNSTGNQGLLDNNAAITRRLFTVGNFSRFVRPGYYRIGVSNYAFTLISAYKDTNSGNFAIVAVNAASTTVTQIFNLTNFPSIGSVTPWITSSNLSLASQAPVSVTSSSFTYALPALSVVTFVGQVSAPNTAPAFLPVPDQVINAGYPLQVTNFATDPDLPSQTLAFNLLSGPAAATLTTVNGTNAVFAWRPLVSQAGTTNPVSVVVTDNGSPNLSATNHFAVTVNPLTNPVVGPVTVVGRQVSLTVNGPQGPDYTLLTTTNLAAGWQVLYTTNSPLTPLSLVDTNVPDPARFYRIEIGP